MLTKIYHNIVVQKSEMKYKTYKKFNYKYLNEYIYHSNNKSIFY